MTVTGLRLDGLRALVVYPHCQLEHRFRGPGFRRCWRTRRPLLVTFRTPARCPDPMKDYLGFEKWTEVHGDPQT